MADQPSNWELARDWVQTAAALVFLPVALVVVGKQLMFAKIWPATFFDVQTGKARKHLDHTPPTIEIKVIVRLKCRVAPVDQIYLEAFGLKNMPHNAPEFMEQYAEGFSYNTKKGKSSAFEMSTHIRGLGKEVIESWGGGGQAVLVIEHGWRKGKRAIRSPVEVELQK